MSALVGTVYLLHFDAPFGHARHYTGWTPNLADRLARHAAGHGARLTQVVKDAGIGWQLARTWPEVTRSFERRLKNQGGASRRCPSCGIHPRAASPPAERVEAALPAWTIDHLADGPWHWALEQPGATAACESCRCERHLFEFDLSVTDRLLCLACVDGDPATPHHPTGVPR